MTTADTLVVRDVSSTAGTTQLVVTVPRLQVDALLGLLVGILGWQRVDQGSPDATIELEQGSCGLVLACIDGELPHQEASVVLAKVEQVCDNVTQTVERIRAWANATRISCHLHFNGGKWEVTAFTLFDVMFELRSG